MSFVNQYRSTTVFGELKVQKFNNGNIAGLLDVSGNALFRGAVGINGKLYATDGTVDVSGNLTVTGDAEINSLTIGRGSGNISTNTALGGVTLLDNTTGDLNTAVGFEALHANTTGSANVGVGYEALNSNTTGTLNTAIGTGVLRTNTGSSNTGVGFEALNANTTGNSNVSVGQSSMTDNTTGSSNVGVGDDVLDQNTTGSFNVGVGDGAGRINKTGSYNTFLGYDTDISGNVVYNHSTALGADAIIDASNQLVLGTADDRVLIRGNLSLVGSLTGTGISYNTSTQTLSVTNINGTITNNATTVTIATDSSNQSFFPTFVSANTGNLPLKVDAGITYNPSTNILTSTFAGNLTGTASTATVATNVTATNASTDINFRVAILSPGTGTAAILSNGGLVYNPITDILSTTIFAGDLSGTATVATNVTATAVSTNSNFRVPFLSDTSGTVAIRSDGGLLYNPNKNLLTTSSLTSSYYGGQLAGVWLVNGSNRSNNDGILPLFCSQKNLANVNNQGALTEVPVTGNTVVGSLISNYSINNVVDTVIIFPNWGIEGFDDTDYNPATRINLHNDQDVPIYAEPSSPNVLTSCKIYFNKVEITGLNS